MATLRQTPPQWFAAILRCVRADEASVCRRPIEFDGDSAVCRGCGNRYQVVRGVPVLKEHADPDAERHFDWMADVTSRDEQIRTEHTSELIRQVEAFIAEQGVAGPVLEIGCGLGLLADRAPRYIGLEYSLGGLLTAGFENAARVCGDARKLPFSDESIQLVVTINVLEHVDRVDLAFVEIDRV